jgi:hypothetical protein
MHDRTGHFKIHQNNKIYFSCSDDSSLTVMYSMNPQTRHGSQNSMFSALKSEKELKFV